ncbi:MAG: hypothetical protein ACREQ2_28995 [Candidatus Binatia bacterium]
MQITFPVAYGLEAPRDADKIGAFWEERRKIIHATNFILDSDKKVCDASYSIGPIGRIVAADALSHIQILQEEKGTGNIVPGSAAESRDCVGLFTIEK